MTETAVPNAERPPLLMRLRDVVTEALRFWEPLRIVYNAVLAIIVIGYFIAAWPASAQALTLNGALILFILAVLANVLYCAAYLGDVFVQLSGFRATWLRVRWGLFLVGTAFAAAITRFFALGFFGG